MNEKRHAGGSRAGTGMAKKLRSGSLRCLDGRYRLDVLVARGAMAEVWQAHDLVLRRTVAVKLPSAHRGADAHTAAAIRREARMAAHLNHPQIARIFDYGEVDEGGRRLPFLVMEFAAGPTLAIRIADDGAIAWPETVSICSGIAGALSAAHESSLVHRGVRPGNIVLSPTGVKMVNFGLATRSGHHLTADAGRVWGSIAYLAPEQLDHGRATPAGDLYAFGMMLYHCLAGRSPWKGSAAADILTQRRLCPQPYLPPVPGLPGPVAELYRRCTAARPEHRPTASEAEHVLQAARLATTEDEELVRHAFG